MRKHLAIVLLALAPSVAWAASTTTPASRDDGIATRPPNAWRADDPADSLYRAAKDALNDGDYRRAASLFHRIGERYPKSTYAPDAPYWEAFALYRVGDEAALREAQRVLDAGRRRFPNASTRGDAETLATRINGQLAKLGDPTATARVMGEAAGDSRDSARGGKTGRSARSGRSGADSACATGDGEDDESTDTRIIALNALMQMDAERAMPILRQVLARRDACSETLRRKAVFLVAQKDTPDAADILLGAARNDPDREVRGQAIFWLSQVRSDRATAALDSILHSSGDAELRERAIFALAQQRGDSKAWQTLRDFAKSDAPVDLRRKAVFWLGQQERSTENAAFLHTLFDSPNGAPLRDDIIQAIANAGGEESVKWLLSIARDPKQDTEQRKKALFWLGQQRRVPATELTSLYDALPDRELKEHLIFVLSQRRESAAVDKLFDIARHDSDRSLRGKALFWLGQSNDPRVKQLLMEIINQ